MQQWRALGELGERTLEDIALLQALDVLRLDLAAGEEGGEQSREHGPALVPGNTAHDPAERDADVAVDQPHGNVALARALDGRSHLAARLDTELLAEAFLIGRQRKLRSDHAGASGADHLEQIEVAPVVLVGEVFKARLAQLDRDGVRFDGSDRGVHIVDAALRHVRGTEQNDLGIYELHGSHRGSRVWRKAGIGH